jgi:hypothetical protein
MSFSDLPMLNERRNLTDGYKMKHYYNKFNHTHNKNFMLIYALVIFK